MQFSRGTPTGNCRRVAGLKIQLVCFHKTQVAPGWHRSGTGTGNWNHCGLFQGWGQHKRLSVRISRISKVSGIFKQWSEFPCFAKPPGVSRISRLVDYRPLFQKTPLPKDPFPKPNSSRNQKRNWNRQNRLWGTGTRTVPLKPETIQTVPVPCMNRNRTDPLPPCNLLRIVVVDPIHCTIVVQSAQGFPAAISWPPQWLTWELCNEPTIDGPQCLFLYVGGSVSARGGGTPLAVFFPMRLRGWYLQILAQRYHAIGNHWLKHSSEKFKQ